MDVAVRFFSIFIALVLLQACLAKSLTPGAETVEIVNELPDRESCKFIGEVVGTQGNWATGDYTSNKNLVIGARNELRNDAYRIGANIVYMQDLKNTNAYGSLGTTNTTAIGKAYSCKN